MNTPHAIFGLEMCYLFAPIILVFFGGALFFGYKLDATRHAAIREALEARDAGRRALGGRGNPRRRPPGDPARLMGRRDQGRRTSRAPTGGDARGPF